MKLPPSDIVVNAAYYYCSAPSWTWTTMADENKF